MFWCAMVVGAFAMPLDERARLRASGTADAPRGASPAAAQPATWDTFTADVTVTRQQVTAAGLPTGEAPGSATFRWERSRSGTGWATSFTLIKKDTPKVDVTDGKTDVVPAASAVGQLEFDTAGGMRVRNREGRDLRLPSAKDVEAALGISLEDSQVYQRLRGSKPPNPAPSAAGGLEWLDAFVLRPEQRDQRRAALVRRFGVAAERYQGQDRFVSIEGDVVHELLVDPGTSVPVEMNVTRNGRLDTHAIFSYTQRADGSLVRRGIHIERVLPGPDQNRRVTEVAFANIRFELRGSRG